MQVDPLHVILPNPTTGVLSKQPAQDLPSPDSLSRALKDLETLLGDQPCGKFTPLAAIDTNALTRHFENEVLAKLVTRGLITDDEIAQILTQEHSGFGAWVGEQFEEADRTKFVARYIERGPISLEKLAIQDDIITYTTKDECAHEFDALEFLGLLSCHIPKPYESITRYYGWYSCRARGERKKRTPIQDSPALEPAGRPSLTWAQCFKRIYEINPLECPRCKSQMRIIAFLTHESPRHSESPRQQHHPRYQELLNRSCSMKFPVMTSSKRCRGRLASAASCR